MLRRTFLGVVCCLLACLTAIGQIKVVRLKSGGKVVGTVKKTVKDGKTIYEVTTTIGGVVPVSADKVAGITDQATPDQEYRRRAARIAPNSAADHFELGQWAFQEGMLAIAVKELGIAKRLDPNSDKAAYLYKQASEALARRREGGKRVVGKTKGKRKKKWLISKRDMNRIRLSELQSRERTKVAFRKKVVDRFIDKMQSSEDFRENRKFAKAFRKWPAEKRLAYILDHAEDDWKILDDVEIRIDPKVFQTFRRRVWPLVAKSCASSNCHGAAKGKGKLKLLPVSTSDSLGLYTNFLILDLYATKNGSMISRDVPERSLLMEYGLPEKLAQAKHPGDKKKAKRSPIFRNTKDVRYVAVRKWIDSLTRPRPNYNVKYQPPFGPKAVLSDPLKSPKKTGPKPTGAAKKSGV